MPDFLLGVDRKRERFFSFQKDFKTDLDRLSQDSPEVLATGDLSRVGASESSAVPLNTVQPESGRVSVSSINGGNWGIIYAAPAYERNGIHPQLWADLQTAARSLSMWVRISSANGGGHVEGSRHYSGNALDIDAAGKSSQVYGARTSTGTAYLEQAVNFLTRQLGYQLGEHGLSKGVLWHVAGHYNHFHMSISQMGIIKIELRIRQTRRLLGSYTI